MTLGEKIYLLRKERGFSQEQLASQITVSRQAISKWELNESVPDVDNIVQLCKIFSVSTDYLLTDDYAQNELSTANEADNESVVTENAFTASIKSERKTQYEHHMDSAIHRFRGMAALAVLSAVVGHIIALMLSYIFNMPPMGFGFYMIFLVGGSTLIVAMLVRTLHCTKAEVHFDSEYIGIMQSRVWRVFFGAVSIMLLTFFLAFPLFAVRQVTLHYVPDSVGDVSFTRIIPELNVVEWVHYTQSVPTLILAACVLVLPLYLIVRKKLGFFSVEYGRTLGLIQTLLICSAFILAVIEVNSYGQIMLLICLAVFIFTSVYYSARARDRTNRGILLSMSLRNLLLTYPLLFLVPLAQFVVDFIWDSIRFSYPLQYGVIEEFDFMRVTTGQVGVFHLIYTALILSGYFIIKNRIVRRM